MVEIVNVVASGALNVELDLERLADDIGEPVACYDPDKYPGMYLRFEEDAPLITVYRTGKFIITGADSEDESYSLREQFLSLFSDMGVIEEPEDKWFAIQNYVCTGELEQNLDLNALAIGLGLENTEYEPEQFPGLVYRPESGESVLLIFNTGQAVITGARDLQTAENSFKELKTRLSELFKS
ncbi:TATA-box-binding protein [Halorarum halophilum]|uniref:TATA-box-binding protein n=1 Tax=Halorarum halophilum TaxID=2743090 RepID=A0A7D5KG94_9EURY|nr:TATA-box-binding protein [Halobaculum halophilum]QLG28156.1 TATA-box-binding protein [Halobaculum halophilum]